MGGSRDLTRGDPSFEIFWGFFITDRWLLGINLPPFVHSPLIRIGRGCMSCVRTGYGERILQWPQHVSSSMGTQTTTYMHLKVCTVHPLSIQALLSISTRLASWMRMLSVSKALAESSPVVGSSKNMSLGSSMSSMAIDTRLRSPPLMPFIRWPPTKVLRVSQRPAGS